MPKRARGGGEERNVAPTEFAQTTPPGSPDISMWLLNAVNGINSTLGRMDATLKSLEGQLARVEGKLGTMENEVSSHAKWIHTLKALAAIVVVIVGWVFVNAVWPWLKLKLLGPP